ncbi:hypothetical protein CLOP_g17947 [Closterium sp. NIES-67]|nr:hypothetical protein CLOP_g17947 [Closterium sp. NIES-67]
MQSRSPYACPYAIKWRCYVHMQPVTVLTEHCTLQYLKTQPHLTPRQARWMEYLEHCVTSCYASIMTRMHTLEWTRHLQPSLQTSSGPKLSHDVRSYVHSSHMCQCNKARNTAPYCLLHPLEIPQVPWSHVALDFITDAPRTSSHYNAILTVVDKLRKMAHFLPTSTTVTAEHVADLFFKEVVRLHGIPAS